MGGKQHYFRATIFMLLTLLGFKSLQLLVYCGLNTFRSTIFFTIMGTMTACLIFKKYYKKHYNLHVILICILSAILNLVAIGLGEASTLFIICDGDLTLWQSITQVYDVVFNQKGLMDIFDKNELIKIVNGDLSRALYYTAIGSFFALVLSLITNIKEIREARAQKEAELQSIIAPVVEEVKTEDKNTNKNTKFKAIIIDLSDTIKEYKYSKEKAKFKQALKEFYHTEVDTLSKDERQNLTLFAFEYGKENAYNPDISKACSLLVKYAQ